MYLHNCRFPWQLHFLPSSHRHFSDCSCVREHGLPSKNPIDDVGYEMQIEFNQKYPSNNNIFSFPWFQSVTRQKRNGKTIDPTNENDPSCSRFDDERLQLDSSRETLPGKMGRISSVGRFHRDTAQSTQRSFALVHGIHGDGRFCCCRRSVQLPSAPRRRRRRRCC